MRVAILLCLALSACCDNATIIETKEVVVPVVTKCKVELPAPPKDLPKGDKGDLYDKAKLMIADLEEHRIYGKNLRAALSKCSEQ